MQTIASLTAYQSCGTLDRHFHASHQFPADISAVLAILQRIQMCFRVRLFPPWTPVSTTIYVFLLNCVTFPKTSF